MPSYSEGLPVVGVQALVKGLAIVASRIGGFLDLVDHDKNGYLIEVRDQAEFIVAFHQILSNREHLRQFRRASLEKARDFDIRKVVDQYETLLREITGES